MRTEKIKVLIIDDEVDFCHVIVSFLKKRGYEAIFAHTLKSGLQLLQKIKPQILFLDNHLPDGRGWEYTAYLLENYPLMNINLISAFKDSNPDVGDDGKVTILEKPLSLNQLNEVLSSCTYSSSV